MLTVNGLSQRFGSLAVLDRVSFSMNAGEFVSIVGPSGCGKTVLLRLIAGLLVPTGGEVKRAAEAGYAFQKSPLFPWLSLFENARICAGRVPDSALHEAFAAAGLSAFESELPGNISVGMRQKVNVIRAFASGRPLVLMDEPFASLDFPGRQELRDLTLRLWARDKKTILFVTHDVDEAIRLSGRVLVFSPRPARIIRDIAITAPQPRDRLTFGATPEYSAAFREIAGALLASGEAG